MFLETRLSSKDGVAYILKHAFDMDLQVSGGWGYDINDALIIMDTQAEKDMLEHTLASMRVHLELSLTRSKEQRYGGINLQEVQREVITKDSKSYDVVTYSCKAMLESDYAMFIKQYKEGHGKDDFDITSHFEQREEATLSQDITIYFMTN